MQGSRSFRASNKTANLLSEQKSVDTRTENEQILGLREYLIDSVKARLQADVPIGIYLSGGIDSAIVAGIAKHLLTVSTNGNSSHASAQLQKPLTCFGVGFEEGTEFDEMRKLGHTYSLLLILKMI
jgi:asparagine synthase (glutamine-hydrolysing)